jgi:hypothetical protein
VARTGASASLPPYDTIDVSVIEGVSRGNDVKPWHLPKRGCKHRWHPFSIKVSEDKLKCAQTITATAYGWKRLARVETQHRRSAARVLETAYAGTQQAANVDDLVTPWTCCTPIQAGAGQLQSCVVSTL